MSSTKRKAPPVHIARPQTARNAKPLTSTRLRDSKNQVIPVAKQQLSAASGEAIEISSGEEDDQEEVEEEDDDVMDDDDVPAGNDADAEQPKTNGHAAAAPNGAATAPKTAGENDSDAADADEDHEPTFGDLVREHETVDVTALLGLLPPAAGAGAKGAGSADGVLVKAAGSGAGAGAAVAAAAPTLASLGHLLNAALRSGDDANLEVCFNTTTDAVWVRNTIQRLDPALAGALLQKLAARIHSRPGRAHTLIGWVQWTLITHGGALLSNQPGVVRALQELHRVLEERARGLNSLLLLKGKLDMLEAQMQMRRLQRAGGSGGLSAVAGGVNATVGGRTGSRAVDNLSNAGRGRSSRKRPSNLGGVPRRPAQQQGEEYVKFYREEWDNAGAGADGATTGEAGQILVNGASAVAGESFAAESDDNDNDEEEALDEDDDADSDEDGEDEDEDDEDVEEIDEAAEEDEVDFDDVDEDDDDDDDDDDDEAQAAAAPPPAKVQKKSSGAFSKRR